MIVDAFAQRKKAEVMQQTWGHLRPEPQREYYGIIIATHTEYGNLEIIKSDFSGLECSPWQFDHFYDFTCDKMEKFKRGTIAKFEGTYRVFKNGNCRFYGGKFKEIEV